MLQLQMNLDLKTQIYEVHTQISKITRLVSKRRLSRPERRHAMRVIRKCLKRLETDK